MPRPTIWFEPSEQAPFYHERQSESGPPAGTRVLEISSRSGQALGRSLSAMNLRDPDTGKPVEAVYQAAKCYGSGGPAGHVLSNGYDAKREDAVRRRGGELRGFEHGGQFWPASTGTRFYDRLWMRAAVAHGIGSVGYDAFSDMFHGPRSMACQARSMAMLQGMIRARQTQALEDPETFERLMTSGRREGPPSPSTRNEGPTIRIAVCGDAAFENPDLVERKLDELLARAGTARVTLIDSGGDGPEIDAARWAAARGIAHHSHAAERQSDAGTRGHAEALLRDVSPHLVIDFSKDARNHPLANAGSAGGVAVEQVDATSETTLTATGRLTALEAIGAGRARLAEGERLDAPAPAEAARIANADPATAGEIRIAVCGSGKRADSALIEAKLEELRERAAPAALRLACRQAANAGSAEHVVETWARKTGTRCDRYGRTDALTSDTELWDRVLDEQKPHLVATFSRGEEFSDRAIAGALRRNIPVEQTDPGGRTWTSTGNRVTFSTSDRHDSGARPNAAWVNPIEGRTAADTARLLPGAARKATWAQHGAQGPSERVLNLRHRETEAAINAGRAVRVDRRTEWGNPFPLPRPATKEERNEAIERYRDYLAASIDAGRVDPQRLARLAGRQLACHCAPEACHAEVLAAAADWIGRPRSREAPQAKPETTPTSVARESAPVETTPETPSKGKAPTPLEADKQAAPAARVEPEPVGDPFERQRALLERMGASTEQLARYDDAVTEHYLTASEEEPAAERIANTAERHPAMAGARALDEHRKQLADAGAASERQLARLDTQIGTLQAAARHAAAMRETERAEPSQSERRTLQTAAEPARIASEIARVLGRSGPAPVRRPSSAAAPPPAPAPRDDPNDTTERREVRVAVCGARRFDEVETLRTKLDEVRGRIGRGPMRLITGGSTGAETAAARWAVEAGVPCDEYPPDWEQHGRAAAYRRNPTIIEHGQPHVILSFQRGDNPVGDDLVELAETSGIPIEEVGADGRTACRRKQADLRQLSERGSDERVEAPEPAARPAAATGWTMAALDKQFGERPESEDAPAKSYAH